MDNEATILDKLIDQLRTVLAPYYGKSDPSAYAAQYSQRCSTFDPWSDGRKDDADAVAHTVAFAGSIPPLDYELLNPRVDIVGDAAVFTLNLEVLDPASGRRLGLWNTTQIHDLATENLDLVHAHWSYAVEPKPGDE